MEVRTGIGAGATERAARVGEAGWQASDKDPMTLNHCHDVLIIVIPTGHLVQPPHNA